MNTKTTCKVCGRRAKQWPLKNKIIMCMEHYNKYIAGKIDQEGKIINKPNGKN